MGGGIILLGIMAVMIPEVYMVIALHGVIQLFSNATRTWVFRKHIKKQLINQFAIGSGLGLLLSAGLIFLLIQLFQVQSANQIKVEFLKPLIGLFILWYLYLKGPKKPKSISTFIPVGGISGISSVFIGATGPLIAPFFLDDTLIKENVIANKAACQVITHLGKIPLFILFFQVDYLAEYPVLLPLILAVFAGTHLGKKVLDFIPEKLFRNLFKIALTLIAVKLIFGSFL